MIDGVDVVKTAVAATVAGAATDYIPPDLWDLPWTQFGAAALLALVGGLLRVGKSLKDGDSVTWKTTAIDLGLACGAGLIGYSALRAAQVADPFVFGPSLLLCGWGGAALLQLAYDKIVEPIMRGLSPPSKP